MTVACPTVPAGRRWTKRQGGNRGMPRGTIRTPDALWGFDQRRIVLERRSRGMRAPKRQLGLRRRSDRRWYPFAFAIHRRFVPYRRQSAQAIPLRPPKPQGRKATQRVTRRRRHGTPPGPGGARIAGMRTKVSITAIAAPQQGQTKVGGSTRGRVTTSGCFAPATGDETVRRFRTRARFSLLLTLASSP